MNRPLLPGEYAVLGLLSLGPMHGYEMARRFASDLADVCPIEQPSLYTYVRNVEGRRLIAGHEERVGARPSRKVFRLTEAGCEELDEWLRAPVLRMREVRLDFLLKLYFLRQTDPAASGRLVDAQIEVCRRYLTDLDRRDAPSEFQALVLASKRSAALGTLEWLTAYREELARPGREP